MERTTLLYLLFLMFAASLSIWERRYSLKNERRLLGEGEREVAPVVFRMMVPVYILIFPAALLEHSLLGRRPPSWLVAAMILVFVASKALKLWAVLHLREVWTMKVVVPRSLKVVGTGPYRHLRHPNYVAVVGEILSMPLVGGAVITAVVGTGLFTVLLVARVRTEEAALMSHPEYVSGMADRARFIPRTRP